MEIIIILAAILQSIGISLGVGSSTLAITNFFVAIADGTIDENERRMMGIVYIVLRIAMVLILITTALLSIIQYSIHGTEFISSFVVAFWILISVLFANAILMTKHIMPSTFGPAIQAATWYTMGVLTSLSSLGLMGFSLIQFILAYTAVIFLAASLVNGMMAYLKGKREPVTS